MSDQTLQMYTRGKNPNSYRGGRPKSYSEEKKRRMISVTESGWEGATQVIEEVGCSSISEFLERLGRGEIRIA